MYRCVLFVCLNSTMYWFNYVQMNGGTLFGVLLYYIVFVQRLWMAPASKGALLNIHYYYCLLLLLVWIIFNSFCSMCINNVYIRCFFSSKVSIDGHLVSPPIICLWLYIGGHDWFLSGFNYHRFRSWSGAEGAQNDLCAKCWHLAPYSKVSNTRYFKYNNLNNK